MLFTSELNESVVLPESLCSKILTENHVCQFANKSKVKFEF